VDHPLGCLSLLIRSTYEWEFFCSVSTYYTRSNSSITFVVLSLFQRGIGEKAVGLSLSLVAPSEDKIHAKLSQSLEAEFSDVVMDSRLLHSAQERVNLASKVVSTNDTEQKTNRENEWFRKKAEEAGLEMDDNLLDEGLAGGDLRDQSRLREAQKGRNKLRQILSEPMQTQKYGKFLSTNTAARQNAVVPPVLGPSPYASQEPKKKPKRRKKG
jgi:ATP-dependent RNA helicase DDX24/MAK5